MKFFNSVAILSLAFFSVACSQQPITSVYDPKNDYTAETVYQKELPNYPQIQLVSSELPEGVAEFKNLSYVKYGRRELQLDLYAPATTMNEKRPAIVLVHGGGWRSGYREGMTPLAQQLALRGYVTATISYRLAPEAKYPAAIHDVKAAIRWLRVNAETYDIDVDKIAIAGGSAGGQIASLTGVTAGIEKFDPQARHSKVSSDVQAIINIDGLSDFTSEAARFHEDDPRKNPSSAGFWFGGNYATKTELWHEASPIYYVNKNTPPMLFIKSSVPRFSVGQEEISRLLDEQRINNYVEIFRDAPHSFWLLYPWMKPTATIMANFLDAQFAYRMTCH